MSSIFGNDIDLEMSRSASLGNVQITDEDRNKAIRAIAGSDACRGAGDAKELLEAIGLYEFATGGKA